MEKTYQLTDSPAKTLIHIVCGPTAGGKSAYALDLAAKTDGVIINADSRQVYKDMPILTACPGPDDLKAAPHLLYGILGPEEHFSAGNWRERAMPVIEETLRQGKAPIVTGGSGLYIKALMEGLSPIPDIPPEIRRASMALQQKLGNPGFYEELKRRDPVMAARYHPQHTARLIRAWEVLEATGKSLAEFQAQAKDAPPEHWHFEIHKIMPEREDLHRNCDLRFLAMLERGALEEVEDFAARIESGSIPATSPLIKSLGYSPILDYVKLQQGDENDLYKESGGDAEKALSITIAKAQTETRQYAKRQMTWFRNQL